MLGLSLPFFLSHPLALPLPAHLAFLFPSSARTLHANLIDFDHYLAYVLAFGDFSLMHAVNFFETNVRQFCHNGTGRVFLLFHNIETFVALLVVSTYIPIVYFLFFGMIFHYGCDLCYDHATFRRFLREFSIIAYMLNPKKVSLKKLKTPLK